MVIKLRICYVAYKLSYLNLKGSVMEKGHQYDVWEGGGQKYGLTSLGFTVFKKTISY